MSEFTYRGMPLPADFDPRVWTDDEKSYNGFVTGWANYLQGVDAALESRVLDGPELIATAPVKDTYTELTDGEGDVWFELPGGEGLYGLWTSWEARTEAGEFFATRPGLASTRDEVRAYGGITSERERTGDTR